MIDGPGATASGPLHIARRLCVLRNCFGIDGAATSAAAPSFFHAMLPRMECSAGDLGLRGRSSGDAAPMQASGEEGSRSRISAS